jgi:hypothetical protein
MGYISGRLSLFVDLSVLLLLLGTPVAPAQPVAHKLTPLVRTVDLDVGQSQTMQLHDGSQATVRLLALEEIRDSVCKAVRRATADVEINGQAISLVSSTYHLPVAVAGVRIDCPVTRGYTQDNSKDNPWGWSRTQESASGLWTRL